MRPIHKAYGFLTLDGDTHIDLEGTTFSHHLVGPSGLPVAELPAYLQKLEKCITDIGWDAIGNEANVVIRRVGEREEVFQADTDVDRSYVLAELNGYLGLCGNPHGDGPRGWGQPTRADRIHPLNRHHM